MSGCQKQGVGDRKRQKLEVLDSRFTQAQHQATEV